MADFKLAIRYSGDVSITKWNCANVLRKLQIENFNDADAIVR